MNKTKITVETIIYADSKKVWDFWTSPEHITKWNFASDDWHCPKAENDLKVGGKLRSGMEAKDGSFGFDFEAIYDEIHPQPEGASSAKPGSCETMFRASRFESISGTPLICTQI